MGSERRVAACVLLLVAALPLLFSLLPQRALVAAIPAAALLIATALVLAPMPATVRAIVAPTAWFAGACTLAVYSGWFAPMGGVGWLLFVPVGLALLSDRGWLTFAGFASTFAVVLVVPDGPSLATLAGFRLSVGIDLLGPACAVAWAGWQVWSTMTSRTWRQAIAQQHKTARSLDEAIARDRQRLESVAATVADPSLSGPVREHGLGPDALALAARIDDQRILLGWIDGPPMATLTAGWALLAGARAGLSTPRELLRFARGHLDEVVPPTAIRWLGVWDRRSTYVEAAPIPSGAYHRCSLSSRGPNGTVPSNHDTHRTVAELLELPEDGAEEPETPPPERWAVAAAATSVLAAVIAFVPGPLWLVVVGALMLCAAHWAQHRTRGFIEVSFERGGAWLADRIEVHDDLRFQAAKVHGGMLPYRIEVGDAQCTAHRLRGEVLDGAFADMVIDDRGTGHVVAGEIAGRGIAARFLGVAAQVTAHVRLSRVSRHSANLGSDLLRRLEPIGETLGFPVRLRVGEVSVLPSGRCAATGLVGRMVEVREHDVANGPAAASDLASVTAEASLTHQTRLYISPAAARPGPEDDAPALAASEAADRIQAIVTSGRWQPGEGTLPSLFSLVFDGRDAPAHGTLIEIALRGEEESVHASLPLVAV